MFGIRFGGSDYESRCVSSGFLSDNNKETVFLVARLHRVVFLYQGDFRAALRGALRGLRAIVSVLSCVGYCQK